MRILIRGLIGGSVKAEISKIFKNKNFVLKLLFEKLVFLIFKSKIVVF